jgi:hypothetical protein
MELILQAISECFWPSCSTVCSHLVSYVVKKWGYVYLYYMHPFARNSNYWTTATKPVHTCIQSQVEESVILVTVLVSPQILHASTISSHTICSHVLCHIIIIHWTECNRTSFTWTPKFSSSTAKQGSAYRSVLQWNANYLQCTVLYL